MNKWCLCRCAGLIRYASLTTIKQSAGGCNSIWAILGMDDKSCILNGPEIWILWCPIITIARHCSKTLDVVSIQPGLTYLTNGKWSFGLLCTCYPGSFQGNKQTLIHPKNGLLTHSVEEEYRLLHNWDVLITIRSSSPAQKGTLGPLRSRHQVCSIRL